MPLDNSNYISDMNLNNPVGNIDTVSMTDDFFREIKKTIKQSFPNINKQTTITSDELNNLKANMVRSGSSWDVKNSTIINVTAVDNSTAVQPRSYNDGRYLQRANNLTDVADRNAALFNILQVTWGGTGYNALMSMVANMMYPVGTMYINYSRDNNPRDFFGYGTWAAYSQGRVLMGAGYTVDDRGEGRTYGRGAAGGEYQHILNGNEIPPHSHPYRDRYFSENGNSLGGAPYREGNGGYNGGYGSGDTDRDNNTFLYIDTNTANTGSGWGHNNMQPFVTVAIWVRTA